MSRIKADFSVALRKTQALARVPKATKYQATSWAAETLKLLKRSAASMQKSGRGRKTGQLARNVGMEISADSSGYRILLGTGVGGTQSVKYAKIQDEGGTIRAKGKKLTIPLGSTKGRISNYPGGFFLRSKRGNVLYCLRVGSGKAAGIKPLFLLRDEVTLPETKWFSGVITRRKPELGEMMKPATVLRVAGGMAETAGI